MNACKRDYNKDWFSNRTTEINPHIPSRLDVFIDRLPVATIKPICTKVPTQLLPIITLTFASKYHELPVLWPVVEGALRVNKGLANALVVVDHDEPVPAHVRWEDWTVSEQWEEISSAE